jgi:hypothetical protein
MATTLDTKVKHFETLLPFIQKLVDIRAVTFRSFFSSAIAAVLRLYFEQNAMERYTTLRDWWNKWGTRSDKKLELCGTCVLATKGFITGQMFEVSYTQGIGFGALRPVGSSSGPALASSLVQPPIEGYDLPFEEDVFLAFLVLKAKDRVSHSVILRGITLEEVQSRFPDVLSSFPQLLLIENDSSSMVIL